MDQSTIQQCMSGENIALAVIILFFTLIIIGLSIGGVRYFTNLSYKYKLPVVGTVPNLQMAVVPLQTNFNTFNELSSNEPSSNEPSSNEPSSNEPSSNEPDQTILTNLFSNEKRNMDISINPFGNYNTISPLRKQEAKEIDNLLQRLQNASNSAFIQ